MTDAAVSEQAVRRYHGGGRLPARVVLGRWLFDRDQIEEFAATGEVASAQTQPAAG